MLMSLYSVYDKVTQVYGPILMEVNDMSLRRNCKTMILNELNAGNKSLDGFIARRSDLVVYKLGTYDTEKGRITTFNANSQVFNVVELVDEVYSEVHSKIIKKESEQNAPEDGKESK